MMVSGFVPWGLRDGRAAPPSERGPLPTPEALEELPPDGGEEFNRLVFEKSPYLLQHARNPVHWYPWGEEAFEKARKEDKPIFLSIGYSTCHWCHVMEHESFEDDEVAALLNEHFVSVKVDREERPDIDTVYMDVCRRLTGRGGWPLTVLLTPDKKPFFAGTYFPKKGRFGRQGMMELVPTFGEAWKENRDRLLETAGRVVSSLRAQRPSRGGDLDASVLQRGYEQLARQFDERYGGFGSAPKFPTPHRLSFLLRYGQRADEPQALAMVKQTLRAMRQGGIYDHVGYGFHRYSTDPRWLVPHFEKMLYDQAMLTIAYVEAYQATKEEAYARTAHEIITYVLRDMTSPEGGFYSAEDADSEGIEGKFYLWTADEIAAVLSEDEAGLIRQVFHVRDDGNFRSAHAPPKTNILHRTQSLAATARHLEMPETELRRRVELAREKLFAAREERIHPHKDDKVLTDWNGLMIAAMARAGRALEAPEYVTAARRAADFVWDHLRNEEGRLRKRYREGEAALPAHLEDYAFMVWGLLELYESDFQVRHLERALALTRTMLKHFWDEEDGGLYFTADDTPAPLVRPKEVYDGAIPSGNSVAMLNLLRLARITGETGFEEKAAEIGRAFADRVRRAPSAHAQLLCALDFGIGPAFEVVIAGAPEGDDTRTMLDALRRVFVPNKVVLLRPSGEEPPPITKIASFTMNQTAREGKATAYVCRNHRCKRPTTDPAVMVANLRKPDEADDE